MMRWFHFIFLASLLILIGCDNSPKDPTTSVNVAPIITLKQTSQTVTADQTEVVLEALASDDVGITSTVWRQISGLNVELNNADTLNASFSVPVITFANGANKLVFELTVTDTERSQSTAQVTVIIEPNNYAPSIAIHAPKKAFKDQNVIIKSTAVDQDGEIKSVVWEQLNGPTVELTQDDNDVRFAVPALDTIEVAKFRLIVTDNKGTAVHSDIDISLYPVEQLTVSIEPQLAANEGAVTYFSWQSNSEDVDIQLKNENGESVDIVQIFQSKIYFRAPRGQVDNQLDLEFVVSDKFGQKVSQIIKLTLEPIKSAFAERQLIYKMLSGFDVRDFAFYKVDEDDFSDLVVWGPEGAYWFKANSAVIGDIDKTARLIHQENTETNRFNFLGFFDINADGKMDYLKAYSSFQAEGISVYYNQGAKFSEEVRLIDLDYRSSVVGDLKVERATIGQDDYIAFGDHSTLKVYSLSASGVELFIEHHFEHKIMPKSVTVCDLENDGLPEVFFRTKEKRDHNFDQPSALYSLTISKDATPVQLSSDITLEVFGACFNSNDSTPVFIEQRRTWGPSGEKRVTAIESVNGEFRLKDVSSTFQHLGDYSAFETVDLDKDGLDDLVLLNAFQKVQGIYKRDANFSELTFKDAENLECYDCKLTHINEQMYLKRFEIDSEVELHVYEPFGLEDKTTITLKKDQEIYELSQAGEYLQIRGRYLNELLELKDGTLSRAAGVDSGQIGDAYAYDWNQDGLSDAITVTLDADYQNAWFNIHLSKPEGGFSEVTQIRIHGTFLDASFIKVIDVKDIDNNNSLEWLISVQGFSYTKKWYSFNPESNAFEPTEFKEGEAGFVVVEKFKNFNVDINNDNHVDTLSISIDEDSYLDVDEVLMSSTRIGWFSASVSEVKEEDVQYKEVYDPELRTFDDIIDLDITRDGEQEIVAKYLQRDQQNSNLSFGWYRFSSEGTFELLQLPQFDLYTNFFDTRDSGYLVKIDYVLGEMIEYDYISELQQVIVNRIISTGIVKEDISPSVYGEDTHFYYDIDKDGDLDILLFDEYHIYWHENLGL